MLYLSTILFTTSSAVQLNFKVAVESNLEAVVLTRMVPRAPPPP